MDVPLGIEDELQEQQCNFWDTVEEMEPFNSAKLQSAFQQLMFQEQKRK